MAKDEAPSTPGDMILPHGTENATNPMSRKH
jgi:hypothetical protein